MNYTTIAGKKISQMSMGTVQLGMNYGIANESGKPDTERSFLMLRTALENGVTSLDAARGYGSSEDVIGEFLGQYKGEIPFLTTKLMTTLPVGSSTADVEKELFESIETSLCKLGVQKVNCIMLHRAEDMTKHGEVVPKTMESFIKCGYTDLVGVSVYQPDELDVMLENDIYQATQIPMNILDQKLIHRGYLNRLKEKNICVFIRSIFLQGLFFLKPNQIFDTVLKEYAMPHLEKLNFFAEQEGMSISEFAMSYIRDVPGVTSLVLGADTAEQILENIRCMNSPAISEKTRSVVSDAFAEVNLEQIMSVLSRPKN